jgi:hypothetical protein
LQGTGAIAVVRHLVAEKSAAEKIAARGRVAGKNAAGKTVAGKTAVRGKVEGKIAGGMIVARGRGVGMTEEERAVGKSATEESAAGITEEESAADHLRGDLGHLRNNRVRGGRPHDTAVILDRHLAMAVVDRRQGSEEAAISTSRAKKSPLKACRMRVHSWHLQSAKPSLRRNRKKSLRGAWRRTCKHGLMLRSRRKRRRRKRRYSWSCVQKREGALR